MEYPHLIPHFSKTELSEHFSLTPEEKFLLFQGRKDETVLGFAVLLKTFLFLGYPLSQKEDIPTSVVLWISEQLAVNSSDFSKYRWKERMWDFHLSSIRKFTGFRSFVVEDADGFSKWLIEHAENTPSTQQFFVSAIQRCRQLHLELPSENELLRVVHSAW